MTLPMEKATYRAKAVNVTFGQSDSEKASRFVAIGMEVVDDDNFAGETLTWLGYFTEKTTARTIESVQHMGFKGDDLAQLEDIGLEQCVELLPTVVEIVCDPDEYNGEWTLKIQWINRMGAGRFKAKKPLVGSELKAFAAQLKGAFKNARGPSKPAGNGASSQHPNAPTSKRANDDDLPF